MKNAFLLFVFAALTTAGYAHDTDSWEQKVEAEIEAVESEIESVATEISNEVESAAEHVHN